jgi:hypothetical protein
VQLHRVLPVLAASLLVGCSSSDVTLQSRPTDADSARQLAELVAARAHCGSLEDFDETKDQWVFTCQSGDASYAIRVVPDGKAKRTVLGLVGATPPVKAGAYYLVQAATNQDGTASGGLERFPGDLQETAG